MYSNEYDNEQNSGAGTYTDYNTNTQDKVETKQGKKAKRVVGVIALVMAGVLVGSGICYAAMNAHYKGDVTVNGQEIAEGDTQTESGNTTDTDSENTSDTQKSIEEIFGNSDTVVEAAPADDGNLPTTGTTGNMTVSQIAEKCLPSVVAITNMSETEVRSFWGEMYTQQSQSAGSGIIIGETDSELLILTNYHVVADNVSLSVLFNGESEKNAEDADIINAVIKDYDENRDIAVIAVKISDITPEIQNNISVATIGNSDDLVLGEQIVAIGNALGYGQSVTTGIISALNRELQGANGETEGNKYIQTDAAINPGNSGGAMFNMRGELVGVNSAKISGSTVEGMGYAIPISEIVGDVQVMMTQETKSALPEDQRGYLGVSIVDVTAEISRVYGLPQGAYISAIEDGSGAATAGLQKEDIIVGINGRDISSGSELKEQLAYYAKGDTVTITVAHATDNGYQNRDVLVVLGDMPQGNN